MVELLQSCELAKRRTGTFKTNVTQILPEMEKGDPSAAEPLLVSGYEGFCQHVDKMPEKNKPFLNEVLRRLVQSYEAMNQPKEATVWKAKFAERDSAETRKVAVPDTN